MTTEPESPSPFYRSAWVVYLVLAVIGIVVLGRHHGDLSWDLFIDTEAWWLDLFLGVGTGLLLVGFWRLGREVIPSMREVETVLRNLVGPLTGSEIFALALISGFSEELLFRGALQSAWGWHWALALFTVLHTGPGRSFRYWTLFALVAGGAFAFLTLSRGNLLPAIVGHMVVNGINMSLMAGDPEISEPS